MMSRKLTKMYDILCDAITDELVVYEEMIRAMKIKQQAIIDGKIEKLKSAVHEEGKLSLRVKQYVDRREAQSTSIGTAFGIGEENISLKDLINYSESEHTQKLEKLRYGLKSSAHQINQINRENKYLLSASIEHVRGLVSLFLKDETSIDNHYEMSGVMKHSSDEHRILDFQI